MCFYFGYFAQNKFYFYFYLLKFVFQVSFLGDENIPTLNLHVISYIFFCKTYCFIFYTKLLIHLDCIIVFNIKNDTYNIIFFWMGNHFHHHLFSQIIKISDLLILNYLICWIFFSVLYSVLLIYLLPLSVPNCWLQWVYSIGTDGKTSLLSIYLFILSLAHFLTLLKVNFKIIIFNSK